MSPSGNGSRERERRERKTTIRRRRRQQHLLAVLLSGTWIFKWGPQQERGQSRIFIKRQNKNKTKVCSSNYCRAEWKEDSSSSGRQNSYRRGRPGLAAGHITETIRLVERWACLGETPVGILYTLLLLLLDGREVGKKIRREREKLYQCLAVFPLYSRRPSVRMRSHGIESTRPANGRRMKSDTHGHTHQKERKKNRRNIRTSPSLM